MNGQLKAQLGIQASASGGKPDLTLANIEWMRVEQERLMQEKERKVGGAPPTLPPRCPHNMPLPVTHSPASPLPPPGHTTSCPLAPLPLLTPLPLPSPC